MAEEKTTEGTPNEGEKTVTIDMTKFVPKEDHEKAIAEGVDSLAGVKKDLEDAQTKLLSPEYIDYLEAIKDKKKVPTAEELKEAKVPQETIDLINSVNERVKNTETALSNIAAVLELRDVRDRYSDFEDHREAVQKLLEAPGSTYTIEQAYKIAKGEKVSEGTPEEKIKGAEKPGGTRPVPEDTKKEFKDENAAGNAAADEVFEKHGITGDII